MKNYAILSCCLFAAFASPCVAGEAAETTPPVSLGKLEPFWRYGAVLGPGLEGGSGLTTIPNDWLLGDFPYRKRPFPMEVPFTDHLSVVRLLGGYKIADESESERIKARDLAYRDASGKIHYRMELLKPRLQPFLDNGYTNLTLVLDNVPWCFPKESSLAYYGQNGAPRDPQEWHDFIEVVCHELVRIMGTEQAKQLRFRVGTEANVTKRFSGTQAEFLQHYDASASAVHAVIPEAKIGPYNLVSPSLSRIEKNDNVNTFALAEHCEATKQPLDFLAYSCYPRLGRDLDTIAKDCREVWDGVDQRIPSSKGVSREVHEFAVGKMANNRLAHEMGANGAALSAYTLFRLREAGLDRMWHWTSDTRSGSSLVWLYLVLEHAAGGDAWLFEPSEPSTAGAKYLALGSFSSNQDLFIVSAHNTNPAVHTPEMVRFTIPAKLLNHAGGTVRYTVLNRQTGVFDCMRRDLADANLLADEFVQEPERLSDVKSMSKGEPAAKLLAGNRSTYSKLWLDSVTLKPLTKNIGSVEAASGDIFITLRLAAPEVLVLVLTP